MTTTHDPLTGAETRVTRQFRRGITLTFERETGDGWQCVEHPLPRRQRHLRDAIRMAKQTVER